MARNFLKQRSGIGASSSVTSGTSSSQDTRSWEARQSEGGEKEVSSFLWRDGLASTATESHGILLGCLRVSTWHQNLETKAATGVEHVTPVGKGGAVPVLAKPQVC